METKLSRNFLRIHTVDLNRINYTWRDEADVKLFPNRARGRFTLVAILL